MSRKAKFPISDALASRFEKAKIKKTESFEAELLKLKVEQFNLRFRAALSDHEKPIAAYKIKPVQTFRLPGGRTMKTVRPDVMEKAMSKRRA